MDVNITVEDSTTYYRPVLECYEDGEVHRNTEIISKIYDMLPPDTIKDNKLNARIVNPIWHFYKAGVLEKVNKNGHYKITAEGRKLLNLDQESLDRKVLKKYCPKFREWESSNNASSSEEDVESLNGGSNFEYELESDSEFSLNGDSTFEEALNTVKIILKNANTIVEGDYDMLLIKKLPKSDIIISNKPKSKEHVENEGESKKGGKTTHIALTNEKMDIFPFLESFDYFYNDKESYEKHKSKNRFFLEVPIKLYASNLKYLDTKNELGSFDNEEIRTTVTVLRRRSNDKEWTLEKFKEKLDDFKDDDYKMRYKFLGYSVQVELSSEKSGQEFKDFRKLLYVDYYLIILKHKEDLKYDVFAVLPNDGDNILPSTIGGELYWSDKKTITMVSSEKWDNENSSDIGDGDTNKLWTVDINSYEIEKNGENILLYGVPGCGKSFTIKDEYCDDESKMERVVFHPDYTYSDFIGQILPKVDEKDKVTYKFTAGPFTSILKKACEHPNKQYYLIIEEINRGNAPAIFGDIFQLLDRKTTDDEFPRGTSEYSISNPQIAYEIYKNKENKVRIPSNLNIIATMNTADQNVFTLDTAFQRRWKMRSIPNKFTNDHNFADDVILDTKVSWKNFVNYINELILKKNTFVTSSEDKRLGVYFVQKEDLDKEKWSKENNLFAEKVLKYLWDDAFKFSNNVFSEDCKTLEDVIDKFTDASENERFNIFKNKDDLIKYNSDN